MIVEVGTWSLKIAEDSCAKYDDLKAPYYTLSQLSPLILQPLLSIIRHTNPPISSFSHPYTSGSKPAFPLPPPSLPPSLPHPKAIPSHHTISPSTNLTKPPPPPTTSSPPTQPHLHNPSRQNTKNPAPPQHTILIKPLPTSYHFIKDTYLALPVANIYL